MAERKEYGLDFTLRATTDASLNAALAQAQKEFAALQEQVKELNRLQRDVSAYQKQQAALANTGQKIENLTQRKRDLEAALAAANRVWQADTQALGENAVKTQEDAARAHELNAEVVKLQGQIDTATGAQQRQSDRLNELGERLRAAGLDTGNLAQAEADLKDRLAEANAALAQAGAAAEAAAQEAQSFDARGAEAMDAVAEAIAAAGILQALNEIKDAYMECLQTAGDFEAAMSNVEALSGADAEELTELNALAKEIGATTIYTAKEAADAMGYMGMAQHSGPAALKDAA